MVADVSMQCLLKDYNNLMVHFFIFSFSCRTTLFWKNEKGFSILPKNTHFQIKITVPHKNTNKP